MNQFDSKTAIRWGWLIVFPVLVVLWLAGPLATKRFVSLFLAAMIVAGVGMAIGHSNYDRSTTGNDDADEDNRGVEIR